MFCCHSCDYVTASMCWEGKTFWNSKLKVKLHKAAILLNACTAGFTVKKKVGLT